MLCWSSCVPATGAGMTGGGGGGAAFFGVWQPASERANTDRMMILFFIVVPPDFLVFAVVPRALRLIERLRHIEVKLLAGRHADEDPVALDRLLNLLGIQVE